ncbi:MAG: MFS transporter [Acidobacteria bacterium]|nr:MFS transporter [Acidobacteriota bacterium]
MVIPPPHGGPGQALLHPAAARRALIGFLLSGFLTALLGAILPAWGYHLRFEFVTIGHYFLSLTLGVLMSAAASRALLARAGVAIPLMAASVLASGALLFLAFVSPPAPALWRMCGLFFVGVAAGLLNSAIFQALSVTYQHDPAATVNLGGIFFGLGCALVTILVAGTFYAYSVTAILALAAILPALFGLLYGRTDFPAQPLPEQRPLRQALRDVRDPAAVLLAALLFFQFGNEWSIAGWLAVFLAGRLGMSPESSLWILTLYWLSLLLGRVAALAILPRLSHGKLLGGSAAAAMFGCIVLMSTNDRFGAYSGVLLVGTAFAVIYPLVAEKIGHRFTSYHPGQFNGIFSLAMIGAMLAPAVCGYLAAVWGIGVVLALPLVGTGVVVVLISLIWLESKIGG